MNAITEEVLSTIRKIIHASDLYSSQIRRSCGLTYPQLLLLRSIQANPGMPISKISREISLSQATVTTVLDRLEKEGLARRARSDTDRRKVFVELTDRGEEVLRTAPTALQGHFIEEFESLKKHEQSAILSALEHVVDMMKLPESSKAQNKVEPIRAQLSGTESAPLSKTA